MQANRARRVGADVPAVGPATPFSPRDPQVVAPLGRSNYPVPKQGIPTYVAAGREAAAVSVTGALADQQHSQVAATGLGVQDTQVGVGGVLA
ncbi:MAG TPA: hypothetical protein VF937_12805 [Chloroflexota bacterium]